MKKSYGVALLVVLMLFAFAATSFAAESLGVTTNEVLTNFNRIVNDYEDLNLQAGALEDSGKKGYYGTMLSDKLVLLVQLLPGTDEVRSASIYSEKAPVTLEEKRVAACAMAVLMESVKPGINEEAIGDVLESLGINEIADFTEFSANTIVAGGCRYIIDYDKEGLAFIIYDENDDLK